MTAAPDIFDTLASSKVCARIGCGMRFVPDRRTHKYCSDRCRYAHANELRPKTHRLCVGCGYGFVAKRHNSKWCGERCRNRLHQRSFYMPAELWDALRAESQRLGITPSKVAQMCVARALAEVGK